MTSQYSQTVEVKVSQKTKAMQWIGIAAVLFSLGFLMLAIFFKWYFVFPFLVILAIGIVYMHFYNVSPKEFIYDFSEARLVIAKKDLMGKTRRMLSLLWDDAQGLDIMDGAADENDVHACGDTYERGVYQLTYRDGDAVRRLLFAPDDYMLALFKEKLGEKFNVCDTSASEA